VTKEELVEYRRLWAQVEESDKTIAELSADLKDPENEDIRTALLDDIAHERCLRDIITNAVGEPRKRGE